jgi:hypothetical protein
MKKARENFDDYDSTALEGRVSSGKQKLLAPRKEVTVEERGKAARADSINFRSWKQS